MPANELAGRDVVQRLGDADARDVIADDRDRAADQRDARADERDAHADEGEGPPSAINLVLELEQRWERTLVRERATAERRLAAVRRTKAEAIRRDASANRLTEMQRIDAQEELLAVAAHGALTSCAAIVGGIDVLQVSWSDLNGADRAALLESMHNSAVSIVDLLRGLVNGTA